jgi:hypothetical protein
MNTKTFLILLITSTFLSATVPAQNRNSVSVTNRSSSVLNISAIYSAGKAVEMVLDNTQWINYSINVNPSEPFGSISASIASGNVPPGVVVYLEASHDHGSGWGKKGKPTGKIKLGNVPDVLINEIGTCNTGNGKYHGHKLTMSVVITDYALLQSGEFNLYIQYTLN